MIIEHLLLVLVFDCFMASAKIPECGECFINVAHKQVLGVCGYSSGNNDFF